MRAGGLLKMAPDQAFGKRAQYLYFGFATCSLRGGLDVRSGFNSNRCDWRVDESDVLETQTSLHYMIFLNSPPMGEASGRLQLSRKDGRSRGSMNPKLDIVLMHGALVDLGFGRDDCCDLWRGRCLI